MLEASWVFVQVFGIILLGLGLLVGLCIGVGKALEWLDSQWEWGALGGIVFFFALLLSVCLTVTIMANRQAKSLPQPAEATNQ